MERLLLQLESDAFQTAHPVVQCAYAHYAFVAVHPFADGNGRVARALASVYLYRAVGVPLVIFSDQRMSYYDALVADDEGRPQAFVTFIEDRGLDAIAMVRGRLQEARTSISSEAARIRQLLSTHGGLSHAELISAAYRLVEAINPGISTELERRHAADELPADVNAAIEPMSNADCTFSGRPYRALRSRNTGWKCKLWVQEPVNITAETTPMVGVANDETDRLVFIAIDANRSEVAPLLLRLDEVHPGLTASGREKFDNFIRRALAAALQDLSKQLEGALRRDGYLGPSE